MPRFDGTGPRGEGPMTGRGRGRCGSRVPGSGAGNRMLPQGGGGPGRGTGRASGGGFFRRGLNSLFGRGGSRFGS